jgi:hypothetical protein
LAWCLINSAQGQFCLPPFMSADIGFLDTISANEMIRGTAVLIESLRGFPACRIRRIQGSRNFEQGQ